MYEDKESPREDYLPESESESDEDDYVDELPERKKGDRKQRNSVSAEVFGKFNKREDYKPRVIPKSEEQSARILERMNQAFMFSGLDSKETDIVVLAMEEKAFKAGDWVITQGEEGDFFYVVDDGNLDCFKKYKGKSQPTYLKTYEPGESFGELALLYNAPRAASIQAKTDCTCFALDRACFNNIVKQAACKKRERYEAFLSSLELFRKIDPYYATKIADGLNFLEVKAGDVLLSVGQKREFFYFVEKGCVEEYNSDGKLSFTHGAGDYFGEVAFLKKENHNVTCKAKVDCCLLTLNEYSFKLDLDKAKNIIKKNVNRYNDLGGVAGNVDSTIDGLFDYIQQDVKKTVKAEYIPETESSDDDDYLSDDEIKVERKQRQGVSAEVYGKHNKKEDFVPKVVPKSKKQKHRIRDRMKQAFMFSALDEKETEIVIMAMEELKFKAGDDVIIQGTNGDYFYVVDSGTLDCTKQYKNKSEPTYLKTYVAGESFGELALLYNAPRAASIKAKEDSVLFGLDRDCFNNIVKDAACNKRQRYEEFLKNLVLFKGIDPYFATKIADGLKSMSVKKGEQILLSKQFCFVESGQVVLKKNNKPVYMVGTKDYFGELELLNKPDPFEAVALSDTVLLALNEYSFNFDLEPVKAQIVENCSRYGDLK